MVLNFVHRLGLLWIFFFFADNEKNFIVKDT